MFHIRKKPDAFELPPSRGKKKNFFSRHWKPLAGGIIILSSFSYFSIKGCNDSFYAPKEQLLREEYGYNISDDTVRNLAKLQVERGLSAKEVLRLTRIKRFVQDHDSINALFERNLQKTGISYKDMELYFSRNPIDEEMVARTLFVHKDALQSDGATVQKIVSFAHMVKGGRYENDADRARLLAIMAILQGARRVGGSP